jgi:hypothetical protein
MNAHSLPNEVSPLSTAIIFAVVMVLPAIGMIAGGFDMGRVWLGCFGTAIFVGMMAGYTVAAYMVFSHQK